MEIASMGWQRHTVVRGLFSGTLKKKLRLEIALHRPSRSSRACGGLRSAIIIT
jgi:hypothetical protein